MAHECEYCGQECYCDQEDIGGMPQPNNCPHILRECWLEGEDDDYYDD